MRFNKRDNNEAEIVTALQRVGCSVAYAERQPYDLLAGRAGRTYLLEIKDRKGRLRESQLVFGASWKGHYKVVRSVEEALEAVGVRAEQIGGLTPVPPSDRR